MSQKDADLGLACPIPLLESDDAAFAKIAQNIASGCVMSKAAMAFHNNSIDYIVEIGLL